MNVKDPILGSLIGGCYIAKHSTFVEISSGLVYRQWHEPQLMTLGTIHPCQRGSSTYIYVKCPDGCPCGDSNLRLEMKCQILSTEPTQWLQHLNVCVMLTWNWGSMTKSYHRKLYSENDANLSHFSSTLEMNIFQRKSERLAQKHDLTTIHLHAKIILQRCIFGYVVLIQSLCLLLYLKHNWTLFR